MKQKNKCLLLVKNILFHMKRMLNYFGIYNSIRFSPIFLKAWLIFFKHIKFEIQKEDAFYAFLLSPRKESCRLVFDIGANHGWITNNLLKLNCKVIAVEPDKQCQKILTKRFDKVADFKLLKMAISSSIGEKMFYVLEDGCALNTLNLKSIALRKIQNTPTTKTLSISNDYIVHTTTLDAMVKLFGMPCLVKIDVEGHELECLQGLSHAIPLIVFEANLPDFLNETIAAIKKLEEIDSNILFNFAFGYEFKIDCFIDADNFLIALNAVKFTCVDVVCRMSNYKEYFD